MAVHVAEKSSGWARGADFPHLMGAFCVAHEGRELDVVDGDHFDEFMEYEVWSQENVQATQMTTGEAGGPRSAAANAIEYLEAKVVYLEGQLHGVQEAARNANAEKLGDSLRRLRLHGVIPLYVGAKDAAALRAEVESASPELLSVLDQVWMLPDAPATSEVVRSMAAAAGDGMSRWRSCDRKDGKK
ncbi:hypothetical protein [Paracidovorax avenae]|uniref:hypothetical protein n=1 Tax=Paracidovorax avenae TaxID=80867 RepID=UPI001314D2DA|nr:hypothetical protein [Paracidovorax avenae]